MKKAAYEQMIEKVINQMKTICEKDKELYETLKNTLVSDGWIIESESSLEEAGAIWYLANLSR